MVENGHDAIRAVRFAPLDAGSGHIETNTLDGIRRRGGAQEFLHPQRLDFDILYRVDQGHGEHAVDFVTAQLAPGDIVWVRAGQVHQWGDIHAIDGPVLMFTPDALDAGFRTMLLTSFLRLRSHWSGCGTSPVAGAALDLVLGVTAEEPRTPALHREAQRLALAALIAILGGTGDGPETAVPSPPEALTRFRDEIERRFRGWHRVGLYADQLGYSPRTLNRLAREWTGLTAKQLVDERVLLEARRELAHSDRTVAAIAAGLGFDDPSNFSTFFQRTTGQTPGGFRRDVTA